MTDILQHVDGIVNGDRARSYGHPVDNHSCTAEMWTSFLHRKFGVTFKLSPDDVCWLNILQKVSREANLSKEDNIVDVMGYALNINMIHEETKRRSEVQPTTS